MPPIGLEDRPLPRVNGGIKRRYRALGIACGTCHSLYLKE